TSNGYRYKKSNIIPGFEEKAIGCSTSNGPMFGTADLYIQSGSKYCNLISSHYESLDMLGDYLMKSYEVLRVIKQRQPTRSAGFPQEREFHFCLRESMRLNVGYFHRIGEKVYEIEKEIFKAAKRSFENKNKDKFGIKLNAACSIFQELSKSKSYEIYLKANYYLGCCYENGIGCYKNESLALYHFELASNASSNDAKNKLIKIKENL
ncbi:19803_t:CDS:2, partial [Gigaspora margarita]